MSDVEREDERGAEAAPGVGTRLRKSPPGGENSVEVEGLAVVYDGSSGPVTAVEDIDLAVRTGEFVTLLGPSGCGKSTVLHCMGGLLKPSRGTVRVMGVPVRAPEPRRAAFVFQEYALLPWKNVVDNVALGLRFAGVDKRERHEQALARLRMVGLAEAAHLLPSELSGGMQQRVSVARALTVDPDVLLMDEPFGALDEQTRTRIGTEMSAVLSEAGKTVVFVTHSLDEAIFLGDRIIVMSKGPGRIVEDLRVETPRPRSFDYVGTPEFHRLRDHLFGLVHGIAR